MKTYDFIKAKKIINENTSDILEASNAYKVFNEYINSKY